MTGTIHFKGASPAELSELKKIAKLHGGMLNPPDIIAFAENPKTALHRRFEWDDGVAAQEYRLWQAREIVRVVVSVIETGGMKKEVRAFVSLSGDRGEGGYRAIVDVMNDADLRAELLESAMEDMNRFRNKYASLRELAGVFEAMEQVSNRKHKMAG